MYIPLLVSSGVDTDLKDDGIPSIPGTVHVQYKVPVRQVCQAMSFLSQRVSLSLIIPVEDTHTSLATGRRDRGFLHRNIPFPQAYIGSSPNSADEKARTH
jgi:hypothetical protein